MSPLEPYGCFAVIFITLRIPSKQFFKIFGDEFESDPRVRGHERGCLAAVVRNQQNDHCGTETYVRSSVFVFLLISEC